MMMVQLICCNRDVSKELNAPIRSDLNFLSALLDVVSNVICKIGLYMIGSGLYQASKEF